MSPKKLSPKKQSGILEFIEESRAYPYLLFGVMALGVIVLFREFIFSNLMLEGSDTINAGIFFREMLVEHVKSQGSIPRWNPYIFGGMPYVDSFHGDIFYPLSSLKYFGDLFRMLGWNLVLHIFLAGVFMYFTARQFKLSRLAASAAAVGYMFSGYLVSLVAPGHDGKIFVTTLFPLSMLFLDRAFETRPVWNFTWMGIVIGVIILSPHPQMSYFTLIALGLYTLYLLYKKFRECKSVRKIGSLAVGAALAVALGLGISAIQFYPGFKYTKEFSPRAEDDSKQGWDWATSWSLHEEDVMGLVAPEFPGTKVNSAKYPNAYYWGKNAFKDNSEYAGVIVLLLGIVGVFFYRKKGIFFGGLALFALSYALAGTTPIFYLYYYLLPNVSSMRAASMIMFIFSFSLSLSAGMGVQWIIERSHAVERKSRSRFEKYLYIFAGSVVGLALLWSVAGEGMLGLWGSLFFDNLKQTRWQAAMANLPSVKTGFWISVFFVGASVGVIWAVVKRKAPEWVLLALPLLMMVDGVRWGKRFVETVEPRKFQQLFSPNVVTDFLTKQEGVSRTMQWGIFSGDYLPYFDIELVSGYHGNQLRWYDELLGGPAQIPNRILGGRALTNITNPRFLNLVGTRFFLLPKQSAFPVDYFGVAPVTVALDLGQIAVYENLNYFPRAFVVDSLRVVPDRRDIYPQILQGTVDLRRTAFVEEPIAGWVDRQYTDSTIARDSAWIVMDSQDSIVVGYRANDPAPVVVTTAYYDAWRPYAGNEELELFRTDGAFLGVMAPAGTGEIVFRYKSPRYETGMTITFASLGLALLALGLGWFVNKKDG